MNERVARTGNQQNTSAKSHHHSRGKRASNVAIRWKNGNIMKLRIECDENLFLYAMDITIKEECGAGVS